MTTNGHDILESGVGKAVERDCAEGQSQQFEVSDALRLVFDTAAIRTLLIMDWTHLHLALNHVPVLGTPFLLGFLLWSWARGQTVTLRFCLWMFAALAVVSIAIKFTGDFAVQSQSIGGKPWPGMDAEAIGRHEESADQATAGVFFMGIAAAVALFLSRGGRATPKWSLGLLALLALATFALMARTANFGGHIRHPEIRPAAAQTP